MEAARSVQNFFGNVYCSAYVNSLVTLKDGLSQIFPGGLDGPIEDELQRVYGPFDLEELFPYELAAIEDYMGALRSGEIVRDESLLISQVEPLAAALALCDEAVSSEVAAAEQDREDYLNDYNFYRYLQAL